MPVTLRTIKGKFLTKGITQVSFTPSHDVTLDGAEQITGNLPLVVADVVPSTGEFTAAGLPPTSGTGVVPEGWTYRVDIIAAGSRGPVRTFNIPVAPYTGNGTAPDIQLASIAPVAAPGEVALYVTPDQLAQALADLDLPEVDLTPINAAVSAANEAATSARSLAQAVAAAPVNVADTGYDIVVLMGQSNMAGRGTEVNTARLDYTDPRILQYGTGGTFAAVTSLALDPLAHMDTTVATNAGVGPGLPFARLYSMRTPINRKVLLVPSAWGGTGFLKPSSQGGGTLRWLIATTGVNGLYQRTVASAQAALAASPAGSRIVAALWLQGEQDSGDGDESATAYRTALEALINKLRQDLNLPNLPFVLGQMTYEYRAAAAGTAGQRTVRQAVDAVHKAIPGRIANTAFAPGPGPGFTDPAAGTTHYNAAAQRILGRRFFDAYLRAIAGDTTTPDDDATIGVPVAPTVAPTLAAGTPAATSVPLTIGAVANAGTYDVEYKPTSGSTWTVATTTANAGSYTATSLTASTSYDFRARGRSSAGTGPYSTVVTVSTAATGGGGPTFTQRFADGFTTTSSTSIPGFTDVTNDGLGRVDGSGAYLQGTGATVAQRLFTPPTQPQTADQFVDVGIGAVGASSGRSPYFYLRATIPSTGGATAPTNAYFGFYDNTAGTLRLYKIVNSTTTEITPGTGAAVALPSKARAAVVGSTLSIYVNDSSTALYTVTDTGVTTGVTYLGLRYTNTGDLNQRARQFANGDVA